MKKELHKIGISGHFPFDNKLSDADLATPEIARKKIAENNMQMMQDCLNKGSML
jgi:nucleoside 2-deoxyribosyltransferase